MNTVDSQSQPILPPDLRRVFAPIDKLAFGVAFGVAGALVTAGLTVYHLVALGGDDSGLRLLGEYFYGYDVSWRGVAVGAFWGFVSLFVFGWFAAFLRNLILAVSVFISRTRAELAETADFLDHI